MPSFPAFRGRLCPPHLARNGRSQSCPFGPLTGQACLLSVDAEQTLRRLGTDVDQRVRALTTLADERDRFIHK